MANITEIKNLKKQLRIKKLIGITGYLFLLISFYIFGSASVAYSYLRPFGWGILFALVVAKKNPLICSMLYLVGNTLAGFTLNSLYISGCVISVLLLTFYLHKYFKKDYNSPLVYLYGLLSQTAFIVLNLGSAKVSVATIFTTILGLVFFYCCVCFINATITRTFNFKLNSDEIICGSVMLIIFAMGCQNITIWNFELIKFFGSVIILIATYILSPSATFLISALFGVGYAISTMSVVLISTFVCFALVSLAFKTNYKALSVVAIVLCEIAIGLYFKVYNVFGWQSVISVLLGGSMFMLLPKSLLNHLKDMLGGGGNNVAIRELVNRSKSNINKRMKELSCVFSEMQTVYRNMVKGVLPFEEGKKLLLTELTEKVCANCPDKNKCLRIEGEYTTEIFDSLISAGFERGKATLLDVPQYLSSRCGKINFLLNTLNQMLKSYKNYTSMITNMDASRILIGEQLGGVAGMLKKLGEEINLNISFDVERENRILEELSYKNIICLEVIVYDENITNKNVTLLIKNISFENQIIEKVVSKICGVKMRVVSSEPSQISDVKVLTLKNQPNFDLIFGSCSYSKHGVLKNGDAHSLIKIGGDKYMLALCDGMGSGGKAQKISNLTISLIENFYKAGFDNDTILNSVNKLLCINGEENFSAVDLCVLDLHKNLCDFIKLGASYGLIKHLNGSEFIESSSLPIGVLEEMRPHITKRIISEFDTIILMSDGVTDSFNSRDELKSFINSLTSINPQIISEEVIEHAINLNNGECKDDMTVLVARVFPT